MLGSGVFAWWGLTVVLCLGVWGFSGGMSDLVEGVPVGGDIPPVRVEEGILAPIEAGDSGSPLKKMLRRSRGRPSKSRPKSPLLRMAEMRKYGLRGKALRKIEKLGSDELEPRIYKGKKGCGSWGKDLLSSSSDFDKEGEKVIDGVIVVMAEDQKADGLVQNPDVDDPKHLYVVPAGDASDLA